MRVTPATAEQIRAVALAMRERDLTEFCAVSYAATREDIADLLQPYAGRDDVVCFAQDDGTPVAILGWPFLRPGAVTLLFLATDAYRELALSMLRYFRKVVEPSVWALGCHRIEAVGLVDYPEMAATLRFLGFEREAVLREYGAGRQDFAAWVKRGGAA